MSRPRIHIAGSINLDLVVQCERLPEPGETILGGHFSHHPGGKGANQALAARRLGGDVAMIGCVGRDSEADAALDLLDAAGVDLSGLTRLADFPTGVALIAVSAEGENQIVVAPGANAEFALDHLPERIDGAVIGQLEIPVDTLLAATERCSGLVVLNLAPALDVPKTLLERADVLVVNESEAEFYGLDALLESGGLVVLTLGAEGAVMYRDGKELARACPPSVEAVDTTGAGDTFVGALTVALLEDQSPDKALAFACAAGAASCLGAGAQTAIPDRAVVDGMLAG